jgi:hypothetical protein
LVQVEIEKKQGGAETGVRQTSITKTGSKNKKGEGFAFTSFG